jgi:hypothetical protein
MFDCEIEIISIHPIARASCTLFSAEEFAVEHAASFPDWIQRDSLELLALESPQTQKAVPSPALWEVMPCPSDHNTEDLEVGKVSVPFSCESSWRKSEGICPDSKTT